MRSAVGVGLCGLHVVVVGERSGRRRAAAGEEDAAISAHRCRARSRILEWAFDGPRAQPAVRTDRRTNNAVVIDDVARGGIEAEPAQDVDVVRIRRDSVIRPRFRQGRLPFFMESAVYSCGGGGHVLPLGRAAIRLNQATPSGSDSCSTSQSRPASIIDADALLTP